MVRLKDIAQRAGVSIMTVSKVLRDAPDISTATKARIRVMAQQMGYVPDSMAQSLRTRKTKLLGLIVSAITNPVYARIIVAIEQVAFDHGYDVILCQSLNDTNREESLIHRLMSRRVDGLILAPVYRLETTASVYEELKARAVPTIILGHRAPFCSGFASVDTDDLQASYAMMQHLLGLGHKRIAFLAGPPVAPWAQERIEGYRRALREAQIPIDDHLIFNAGVTIDEGVKAAEQLLREKPAITAIHAVNDLIAIGVGQALIQAGYRVPEDISLAGHGNFLVRSIFVCPSPPYASLNSA